MRTDGQPSGQVIARMQHGGHVVPDDAQDAERLARTQESISTVTEAIPESPDVEFSTPFDYLLTDLAEQFPDAHLPSKDHAKVVADLKVLGAALVEDPPPQADPLQTEHNATIPPIYTYWGQFIDHDLTASTDRDTATSDITPADLPPRDPSFVVANLRNLRQPALNLDSVYGDGPTLDGETPTKAKDFYNGVELRLGTAATVAKDPSTQIRGDRIPPPDDLERDLPREGSRALIADGRNDENLIVAQLHVAFLRFHNQAVGWVRENEPECGGEAEIFARARQLTQFHYQWLTVHDYLKTIAFPGVPDQVLLGGNKFYAPRNSKVYMPLEYSVAAFRFGHSMVRAVYDYNRNFGRPGRNLPNASFRLLFTFTGKASPPFTGQTDVLPFNWIIEWDRMVDKGDPLADHFARKIDTRLAAPLRDLTNEGNAEPDDAIKQVLKRLATRNLLRGYLLAIPTGQAVAAAMGVPVLDARELQQDNNPTVNDALTAGGFLEKTPLWYYLLKEAEIHANGNSLGQLGSRILCETIIGQIRHDPYSHLNHDGGWTPAEGVTLPDGKLVVTISDFLRFAKVLE